MGNEKKKVAVITRTKNRPLFLERAMYSVHKQSETDIIHVIINDGGDKDEVNRVVESCKDLTKGRVQVIHNSKSLGMEAASNKAIKSVGSTYIAIHDDDDTWHPDCLKLAIDELENKDTMGVVVRTNKVTEQVTTDNQSIEQLRVEPWMPDMKGVISLYRQCIDNQLTPITFIYKREALESVGFYDESLPVLGDWDFGIRFLQNYDVEFVDPGYALAYYHHRKYNAGSSNNNSFDSGSHKHRYYSNKILNKYLRKDLETGKLGIGYIMNQLRHERRYMASLVEKVLPTFATKRLRKKFD